MPELRLIFKLMPDVERQDPSINRRSFLKLGLGFAGLILLGCDKPASSQSRQTAQAMIIDSD